MVSKANQLLQLKKSIANHTAILENYKKNPPSDLRDKERSERIINELTNQYNSIQRND